MAQTASTMPELGMAAPSFRLPDTTGRIVGLEDFDDKPALLVCFICNHCPYVIHIRDQLAQFAREYEPRGLAVVGINSNDVEQYPDDAPERMAEVVQTAGFSFPYLFDGTQEVAKAYRAACTPDFFLFDANRHLVYRGQFDDSRPASGTPVSGRDIRAAADAVLAGQPVPERQHPSMGCNIKWRPGNEPDYV